jgi:hypothetical protein
MRLGRFLGLSVAAAALIAGLGAPAQAIEDPFIQCVRAPCGPIIVCVTEPCPGPGYPQLPELPDLPPR